MFSSMGQDSIQMIAVKENKAWIHQYPLNCSQFPLLARIISCFLKVDTNEKEQEI
jgi:hypothetical protein